MQVAQVLLKGSRGIEITGREIETLTPQSATCQVSSMGPSDFHLSGYRKKHVASNKFTADPNVKQAVTSCLQTFELNINGDYDEIECVPSCAVCTLKSPKCAICHLPQ